MITDMDMIRDFADFAAQVDLKADLYVGPVDYSIFTYTDIAGRELRVAAFQGTKSFADVRATLKAWHIPMSDVYAQSLNSTVQLHTGFAVQAERVIALETIASCDIFVGHSLGGAIAQILALRYSKACVTFGSPRVGGKAFAEEVHALHTRVVSRGDKVPSLPSRWMGYKHGGTLITVGKRNHPWWMFWKNTDHWMPDYVKGVANNIGGHKA